MTCPVCAAPALPLDGRCVFCRCQLAAGDPQGIPDRLLEYLAGRLPTARPRRAFLGWGGVTRLEVRAAGRRFVARRRRRRLVLEPPAPLAEWVDELLAAVSVEAAADHGLRAALSRAGWAFRPR